MTASILCDKLGLKNAYAFDLQAACSGFLYAMETAASMIQSGRHKTKSIIVGADKMSSMVNYGDRATCPIFGDGAAACMVVATTEDYGIMDSILRTDGQKDTSVPASMKAGGSVGFLLLTSQSTIRCIICIRKVESVFKYADI